MGKDALETLWESIHGRKKKSKTDDDVFKRSSTWLI